MFPVHNDEVTWSLNGKHMSAAPWYSTGTLLPTPCLHVTPKRKLHTAESANERNQIKNIRLNSDQIFRCESSKENIKSFLLAPRHYLEHRTAPMGSDCTEIIIYFKCVLWLFVLACVGNRDFPLPP